MTFNPIAALNVVECKNLINEKSPKAIDLGSQTASINKIFLKNMGLKNIFGLNKYYYLSNIQISKKIDLH